MREKLEFASDAWLARAQEVLSALVLEAGASIAGERVCVTEVFREPPMHLRRDGSDALAWSFEVDGGQARVAREIRGDADYRVSVDYHQALPGARSILTGSPEEMEARAQARREAIAAGRVQVEGSLEHVAPELRALLVKFHNDLARCTA